MSQAEASAFTPTQSRIMAVLADGKAHRRAELRACIDPLAENGNVRTHLSRIRKVLRPRGQDVLCVLDGGRLCYRHVGLLVG